MYKIINQSDKSTEILLYSLITGGMTANQIIKALNDSSSDNITLRINSDGGEIFEAIAIYNYLKDKNAHVVIDGICASAASIIAMAGKIITMKQGSMMMIHNPLTLAVGYADELRGQAEILDKISASMAGIYASRTGKSTDEIQALMTAETWMNDSEALASGFIDEIENAPAPAPAPEPAPEPAAPASEPTASYDDGVKAERERLHALDDLMAPGRESIINRAKYQTNQTAQDIAIELLKNERHTPPAKTDPVNLTNLPAGDSETHISDLLAQAMNRIRGE